MHYLANPERHTQFALLTDWADADAAHMPYDDALLDGAKEEIRQLNTRYPYTTAEDGAAPRFIA